MKKIFMFLFINFPLLFVWIIFLSGVFSSNIYNVFFNSKKPIIIPVFVVAFILQMLFYSIWIWWSENKKNKQCKKYLKQINFLIAM